MSPLDLRNDLQKMTEMDPSLHAEELERLRQKYGHSIELVSQACPRTNDRNCYEYALGIDAEISGWVGGELKWDQDTGRRFMTEYILPSLQEVRGEDAKDSDLIVYFDGEQPTHAGLMETERVISKWGRPGHVYKHRILEVRSTYGTHTKLYKKMDPKKATQKYLEWARIHVPDYPAVEQNVQERLNEL